MVICYQFFYNLLSLNSLGGELDLNVHTLQSRSATHRYLSYRNTRASVQNRMNVDSSIDYGEVFMSRKYEIIVTFCLKCIYFIIRN